MGVDITWLDKVVREMRDLAEALIPHSHPKANPIQEEIISPLKSRDLEIDGYDVHVYYGVNDHGSHKAKLLQLYGSNIPWLPFCMAVKLAKIYLGDEGLSYAETYIGNRKLYIWLKMEDPQGGVIMPNEQMTDPAEFEGFRYRKMHRKVIDFI